MPVNKEKMSKIFSVLSHPLRIEILLNLSEKGECSFTDLMKALDIDTGKLSFHIRSLDAFMEQTPTGRYELNKTGEHAITLINDLESWVEGVEVAEKYSDLQLASFKKRTYAFLIDLFMIFAIAVIIALPAFLFGGKGNFFGEPLETVFFITIALLWLYSTLLEGFNGQTLGKRFIGLKVVRINAKKLSYDYVAVRNFGKSILPLLPFDLLIGTTIKDRRFTRYFDKFAGTTVVDLRVKAPRNR